MTFRTIIDSTTADASDVNDNFYHIAQGSRFPYAGISLSETDNSYYLGSSSYLWNAVYCETLTLNSASNMLANVFSETLNSATSRVEITGLNGDIDDMYEIHCIFYYPSATTTTYYLSINGDTASTYYYSGFYSDGTAISVVRGTIQSMRIGYISSSNASACYSRSITHLYANKASYDRAAVTRIQESMYGTYIDRDGHHSQVWTNKNDTITSLVIWDSAGSGTAIGVGSRIEVYRIR